MNKMTSFVKEAVNLIDPRYLVLINHIILMSTAVLFFGLRRSWEQIAFVLVVTIVAELLLSWVTNKQKNFNIADRILSSAVLAFGALLLVRSSDWWFYGFIGLVGVISKYILVNEKGRHIFNPTNVAIVFAIIVLPQFMNVRVDSFSAHIFSLCCILFFGMIAIIRANSWRITLGYYLGILVLGMAAYYVFNLHPLLIIGPTVNATIVLFAFLMITDPQTSPRDTNLQWIFGISIAVVDLILRYYQLYYSQFMALFIVIAFFNTFHKVAIKLFQPTPSNKQI